MQKANFIHISKFFSSSFFSLSRKYNCDFILTQIL